MKINLLTIGTRGDIQPFIALGIGLKKEGFDVTMTSTAEFESLAISYGLNYFTIRGNYIALAQNPNSKDNPLKIIKEYKKMARDTLNDEWTSIQNSDVLIYNPASFGGYHIAEKLKIPSFAAFPAPMYSPTQDFPCPFFPFKNLGFFNKLSYSVFFELSNSIYKKVLADWRRDVLNLSSSDNEYSINRKSIIKLYCYSKKVIPVPQDWDNSSIVTGYWFLKANESWHAPKELIEFIENGKKPLYFGLGSMSNLKIAENIDLFLEAIELSGNRAIVLSDKSDKKKSSSFFFVNSIPFDWLFPKMSMIIHHGGAGTSGESLKAGKPSIICPIVGDQTFWGNALASIGAAIPPIPKSKLTSKKLADSINYIMTHKSIQKAAKVIGEKICKEDGIKTAIDVILKGIKPK